MIVMCNFFLPTRSIHFLPLFRSQNKWIYETITALLLSALLLNDLPPSSSQFLYLLGLFLFPNPFLGGTTSDLFFFHKLAVCLKISQLSFCYAPYSEARVSSSDSPHKFTTIPFCVTAIFFIRILLCTRQQSYFLSIFIFTVARNKNFNLSP